MHFLLAGQLGHPYFLHMLCFGSPKSQSSSFLAIDVKCLSTGADVVSAIPNKRNASAILGPQYLHFIISILVAQISLLIADDRQGNDS